MKRYKAVYNDSAFTGIGIIDIEYGIEDVCVNEYFSPTEKRKARNKIYHDKEGKAYIKKYGCKYYLDEFICKVTSS